MCDVLFCPQALHYRKYSTASDVWSYGVVMYEIWSLGHKPFEGYTNPEVCTHILHWSVYHNVLTVTRCRRCWTEESG